MKCESLQFAQHSLSNLQDDMNEDVSRVCSQLNPTASQTQNLRHGEARGFAREIPGLENPEARRLARSSSSVDRTSQENEDLFKTFL